MFDEALAWRIERGFFNAAPALRHVFVGDWLARFAPHVGRRANSVNLLRHDYDGLEHRIEACERLYRDQQAAAHFRLPSFLDPRLDEALAARGYTVESSTRTLMTVTPPERISTPGVRVTPRPDRLWLEAFSRFQGHTPARAETYARVVDAIVLPAGFATAVSVDGEIAALGYAVVDDGFWFVESVVTAPALRSQGHARRMLAGLSDWAASQGAGAGCLQVTAGNGHAERLYQTSGFVREIYRYRYRRAPA